MVDAETWRNRPSGPEQHAVTDVVIRPFVERDRDAVVAVWKDCDLTRPWNDPQKDINRKLDDSGDLFFVAERNGEVIGTVMAGYDGHRGWVNYLAVKPTSQQQGVGKRLMSHVESVLLDRGCPKLNLQVRSTNEAVIAFYERLGYINDDCISLGKRLISDTTAT